MVFWSPEIHLWRPAMELGPCQCLANGMPYGTALIRHSNAVPHGIPLASQGPSSIAGQQRWISGHQKTISGHQKTISGGKKMIYGVHKIWYFRLFGPIPEGDISLINFWSRQFWCPWENLNSVYQHRPKLHFWRQKGCRVPRYTYQIPKRNDLFGPMTHA